MKLPMISLGLVVASAIGAVNSAASGGTTVISMPPPPRVTKPKPSADVERVETQATTAPTWLDRALESDVSGNDRSALGVVALTRYAHYKSGPRYTYYSPLRGGYYSNVSYTNYFPFDVSFLHGWPIFVGHSFPGFVFHKPKDCD